MNILRLPKLQPIPIVKGDSQKITLNVGGITLTAQDKVVFSLREKESNDSPLVLQKELSGDSESFIVNLTSQETNIKVGTYYYTYRVFYQDGDVRTLNKPTELYIV